MLWPGVQFRSGQAFDTARIARVAHAVGALQVSTTTHAIGNLPLALQADGADFAIWCSYQYLNAGPGATGGCFASAAHPGPGLEGWWGHQASTRFRMASEFIREAGAAGFALSNPPISRPRRCSPAGTVRRGASSRCAASRWKLNAFEALLVEHVGASDFGCGC